MTTQDDTGHQGHDGNGGNGENGGTDRELQIETIDGELAAIVTVRGTDCDSSPVIVTAIDSAIRDELGHLIRDT